MKFSAGILLYRFGEEEVEFLLIHPGGPIWENRDAGAWSIPKGEYIPGEEKPGHAAIREFQEETGLKVNFAVGLLGEFRQSSYKTISAWLGYGDCDEKEIKSILFEMEYPVGSGVMQRYPEADRAGWFSATVAKQKVNQGQVQIIDTALRILKEQGLI